jgi:hypothetical protein
MEHGPVEIVDLPMKNGGSLHSYVSSIELPEFWGFQKRGGFHRELARRNARRWLGVCDPARARAPSRCK